MPVHSRRKGHSRERAIRHRFIAAGWPDAKRGDQSRAGHEESDVCVGPRCLDFGGSAHNALVRVPGFRCEVKDQVTLPGKRVLATYRQAEKAATADQIPVAIFHVARDDDYALVRLGHLFQLASCGTADERPGSAPGDDVRSSEPGTEARVLEDSI